VVGGLSTIDGLVNVKSFLSLVLHYLLTNNSHYN